MDLHPRDRSAAPRAQKPGQSLPPGPAHHVPDDALLAYAAGVATAGEELLVACHLTLCPPCRHAVEAAERLGEALLTTPEPAAPPPPSILAAIFAQIDAEPSPTQAPVQTCTVFPRPLLLQTGPFDKLDWRAVGGGIHVVHVDEGSAISQDPRGSSPSRVFLVDFPAGMRLPTHGHNGVERGLVLRGGFSDERATFERGDVSWHGDDGHRVTIHEDARCTTLFVNDGPLDVGWLTGPLDWWVGR